MHDTQILIGLLLVVAALAGVARVAGVPYPIVGLVGGLVLGVIPGVPSPHIDPDVVFLVFLPPLLYSAAFLTSPAELRESAVSIGSLAIGLVVVTLVAVAAVAHVLLAVSWPVAFVLGAILSPTDPVAAVAVLRRLGVPDVGTVLEGEALVNDGTGLTAYKVAVGAVGGGFALGGAVGQFALIAAGGVAVGLAAGQVSVWVRKRVSAPDIETTISLGTPFLAYIPAEALGVSGVLAAVAAGLLVGARSVELSAPSTRVRARGFWQVLSFILESTLFLLVGLAVPDFVGNIDASAGAVLLDIAAVTAAVIGVRVVYVFAVRRRASWQERLVQGVSGIRGAVSVAAALALPLDVPDRPLLIAITTGVVLATLAPPSLALGRLVERLGLAEAAGRRRAETEARLVIANAALASIADATEEDELPERVLANLRDRYELRVDQLQERLEDERGLADGDDPRSSGAFRDLRSRVIDAQREALGELVAQRRIDATLADRIGRDLDLESTRLDPEPA